MKITIELDSKKVLILTTLLIFLLVTSMAFAQRRTATTEPEAKPGIASQFGSSFVCILQCGWPAMVLMALPPIAVFIWKKIFSIG